ncbi:ester cyclase [Sphingomonas bacterium]|uniref:nuclear transport factor 2 family protein n=1 Tax=Sphingomonas bacterium TaxID=1895847 RepID=UPI0015776440|nr:ester cyclase [Sphingomonas bacterium]
MTELPFSLPDRPRVTRIRQRDARELSKGGAERTQPMTGYEERFTDIVDYIVRITDEIWMDRAVGYVYDTYDASCVVYSSYGVVRSVEEVIAGTVSTLNAFPDGEIHHLAVAWSGDAQAGFYTSHLGHSRSTNVGRTGFGSGTGRRTSIRFAADCVSRDNRIHTEWLVRDNGAAVRQLGFDLHDVARRWAATPSAERYLVSPETRLEGQAPRRQLDIDRSTVEGWARSLFQDMWNLRRLDWIGRHYAPDMVAHAGGGRTVQGIRNYQALVLHVLTALPDAVMRVENVCWSEETDGVIVAVRWTLEGTTQPGGVLGECPAGKPVFMMGISHLRLLGGRIVEEWMLFDELGVLAQAYR